MISPDVRKVQKSCFSPNVNVDDKHLKQIKKKVFNTGCGWWPDVVNRTFGNRTQSNPVAWLGLVIELNQTHKKILPIEHSVIEQFNNQT